MRLVTVPAEEIKNDLDELLEQIFYYGQNDFQPSKRHRSVSVGDVIRIFGNLYRVDDFGFSEISQKELNDRIQL